MAINFPTGPNDGDTYTDPTTGAKYTYSSTYGVWRATDDINNLNITNSLGVGTAASGTIGEIRAANNITAYFSSDIVLKENIRNIIFPLDKIDSINGVEFDWTDKYIQDNGGEDGYYIRKHDVGVIAQEIEKVLPEVVATRGDGIKAVKYEKIIALLIESVKELHKEVKKLKEKFDYYDRN